MKHLEKPTMNAMEVLIASKENIRNKILKQRIEDSSGQDFFTRRYKHYDFNASQGNYNRLINRNFSNISSRVDEKENMKLLYSKMLQDDTEVRQYYKLIRGQTKQCPYCGFGKVTTLDHFLPKAKYPTYAVYPNNLVPSCYDCNTVKLTSTDVTLHPYYDNVENNQWLYCDVICEKVVSFRFKVEPTAYAASVSERILTHFKTFDLQTSFISFASDEFSGYLNSIFMYIREKNIDGLKADINERYESNRSYQLNHWRTAMYQSLHTDSGWIKFLAN